MNDHPGSLHRLTARFDDLEHRLHALEQRIALLEHAGRAAEAPAAAAPSAASLLLPEVPELQASGTFPVLGRAMLGIAGAYLLRALAESQVLPGLVLALVAIAYALAWLAGATRARTVFAAAVYACTSVLILAPMLWELTLRFKMIPAGAGAATLAVFVVAGFALARGKIRALVLRIVNVSAAALSLALAVVTHANLPFLAVLLLAAGLCEWAQVRNGEACARPLAALAADAGVSVLLYVYRGPASTHADYAVLNAAWLIAPGFLLFAIFAAGVSVRCGWRRQRLTIFDAAQVAVAFLLAFGGLLYFGPAAKEAILGLLCLVLAAVLYAAEFAFLRDQDLRTQIILGSWCVLLVLSAIRFAAPSSARMLCLTIAAIGANAAGAWLNKVALAWHATVFLLAAGWLSGLLIYAFFALAGTPGAAPSASVWLTISCATACYAIVQLRPVTLRKEQPFPFLFAAMAAVAAAALLVQAAARLAAMAFSIEAHHLALIRSLILCLVALALASGGARFRRHELTQIGYTVIVLEAIKLVVEDLRHGHFAYVSASVCLYAFTLIAIPRVAHGKPAR